MTLRGIIYVSGPYSAPSYREVHDNIARAETVSEALWSRGYGAFCPHANTRHMEHRAPDVPYDHYMEFDLAIIDACTGMFMVEGWEKSKGAMIEWLHAQELGLPIFYDLEELL